MRYATTVIIGAGQSGLATSKHLTDRSIDHVLIERGEVANSWQTERWDSASPPHAELAEPSSRIRLRWRRSGRLHERD